MVEPASVRLTRLIVPVAAAAAAATYIALMRDQRQSRRRRMLEPSAGASLAEAAPRVMQPPAVRVPTAVQVQEPTPETPAIDDSPIDPASGTSTSTWPATDVSPPAAEDVNDHQIDDASADHDAEAAAVADDGPVLDEGSFSLGGWAAAPGHTVVSAVTYRQRLPFEVAPDRILLSIEHCENVPDDGLVVLADPGFAPDREGFTLVLAAADPGPFSVSGTYRAIG